MQPVRHTAPSRQRRTFFILTILVRLAGLEPARVTPLPPQSSVSANSTISALAAINETGGAPARKGKLRGSDNRAREDQRKFAERESALGLDRSRRAEFEHFRPHFLAGLE